MCEGVSQDIETGLWNPADCLGSNSNSPARASRTGNLIPLNLSFVISKMEVLVRELQSQDLSTRLGIL